PFSFPQAHGAHPHLHSFPYTTLFRSHQAGPECAARVSPQAPRNLSHFGMSAQLGELIQGFHKFLARAVAGIAPEPAVNAFLGFKDRKSTRLNSSHVKISYAVFCLKKK